MGGGGSNGNMSQVDIGQVVCKLGVKLLHSGQPLLPLVPALLVVKEVGVCWLSIWIGYHNQGIVHLKRVMLVLVDGSSIGNYLQREVIAVIQGWFGS